MKIIWESRIFRALRTVTHVKGLQDLVADLINVLPCIFTVFVLSLLVFYFFGVIFPELFHLF